MADARRSFYVLALVAVGVAAFAIAGCTGKSSTDSTTTATTAESGAPSPAASGGGSATLAPQSWVVPVDVPNATSSPGPSQADYVDFGWQTFIALNWPAAAPSPAPSPSPNSGISGLPDTSQTIGASASNQAMIPTVWLTYRTDANMMLPQAQDPGAWDSPPNPVPCGTPPSPYPVAPGFNPMIVNQASKFGNVNEAAAGPLVDQQGWYVTYDIRVNQSEYTYIQQNGYYNANNQLAAFKANPPTFVGFPKTGTESMFKSPLPQLAQFGALEIKSAWRVLDTSKDQAVIPRYYTQTGYFIQPDGSCSPPTLFGLIGLHILRLTPTTGSTWYWATFEQVDNVTAPPGSPEPATLAKAGTPNGDCNSPSPSPYNVEPSAVSGNIPWNGNNTPVDVCRVTPIPPAVQQMSARWRSALAGTVWANYELVNTLNPPYAGQAPPTPTPIPVSNSPVNVGTLANTSMETYYQQDGVSCMTCHAAFGFPQGAPQTGTYQVFSFLLGDAQTPAPSGVAAVQLSHFRPLPPRHHFPRKLLEIIDNHMNHP